MDNEKQAIYLATKAEYDRRDGLKKGENPTQEGNPQNVPTGKRTPMVKWKRLPWGEDKLDGRSMSDHVGIPKKAANENGSSGNPIDRPRKPSPTNFETRAAEDVDLNIEDDDPRIEELKRKLEEQEMKREEYYKTKDKIDREMEIVIENTEKEHDRLMKIRVEKRKMEDDRDKVMVEVSAAKLEAEKCETSLHMEAARYKEQLEAFDALKTTIENRKLSCPASFSLLLYLQETLEKSFCDPMQPKSFDSAHSETVTKNTYFGLDGSDDSCVSSPVISPSDLFKSYQNRSPTRIPQHVSPACAKTSLKDISANNSQYSISCKQKQKFSKFQRVKKFFRNLFRRNKTWATN